MRDILTIATGGPNDESRLATAAAFARHFEAELTVAAINELPDPQLYAADPAAVLPRAATEIGDEFLKQGRQLRVRTEQRLESLTPAASVVLFDEFRSAVASSIARMARLRDLFVMTKPAESTGSELMGLVLDEVLVEGICGVLCLPNETVCSPVAGHATIAWNGSREAARAVQTAMPILKEAGRVTALLIDQPARRAGNVARAGDDLLARLGHHGIEADLVSVASEEMNTAEAIAAEVDLLHPDVLVMGAQAEGGFRQWLLGSVSRELLTEAKPTLLLAH
jgi:nucleotide-binding universal stress UspA family protein